MTTTEIALRSGATVEVSDEFREQFPVLAPDAELAELMAEALDGFELTAQSLPRVRVPSGGGLFWTLTKDGEDVAEKALTGIIVLHKPQRVFWANPEPSGQAPDCFSVDKIRPEPGGMYAPGGERAAQNPSGLCKNCPMSAPASDLKGGKGSACKEQKLLFMACEGMTLPLVVVAPPSSLRSIQDYAVKLINGRKPLWGVKTRITLEEAQNSTGNKFARMVLTPMGALEPGEIAAVREYGEFIKELIEAAPADEFADAGTVDPEAGGGLTVGDGE